MADLPDSSRTSHPPPASSPAQLPIDRLTQFRLFKSHYDLACAREDGDFKRTVGLLVNVASIYTRYHHYQPALTAFEDALTLVRPTQDRRVEAGLMCALADVYRAAGEPGTALHHFRRALLIAEALDDALLKRACLDGLRRTKTAIMVDSLHRSQSTLLPSEADPPPTLSALGRLTNRLMLVLIAFGIVFVALPIILSQAGLSDGGVALAVIGSGVISALLIRRMP